MLINLGFEHNYQVRDLTMAHIDLSRLRYFPLPIKGQPDMGHITVGVTPKHNSEWIGRFQRGYDTPPAIDAIFSTPNANNLCVVSGGQGYIIDSSHPTKVQAVKSFPVTSVIEATEAKKLVFANFTNLSAWDDDGQVWDSGQVSLDGISIVGKTSHTVFGHGFDVGDFKFDFEVDLDSGEILRGKREFFAPEFPSRINRFLN